MGEVYVADDTKLHRRVALKLLPPLFAAQSWRVTASPDSRLLAVVRGRSTSDVVLIKSK